VARFADPASRRRVLLALTPPAAALVPMLAEIADHNDEAFFGTLPPAQRAELAGLLQRLVCEARAVSRDTRDKKEKES
jgi:DNA-binding MarR family transcriptional regulator